MAIYRTIKYASMHRDANFYAVVYNGRVSAYEISGKDLKVSGFQRVSYSTFIKMMEEAKKRDNVTPVKVKETAETPHKRPYTDMAETQRKIKTHVKNGSYEMTRSEWQWNYLPTV